MLFGIRQSVHSVQYDKVMKLDTVEFKQKTVFEIESMTDKKNSTSYQFCDFAPKVFQVIWNFYGISSDSYLQSIGPENLFGSLNMGKIKSLSSQSSTGKSGSFFYYSSDGRYMLKTCSLNEFEFCNKILKDYY